MKRALTLTLALALVMGLCCPALAENNSSGGDVVITTTIDEKYIVTIPETTDIPFNQLSTDIGDITLTEGRFDPGYQVTVSVSVAADGSGALLHTDGTTTLAYTLSIAGTACNSIALPIAELGIAKEVLVAIAQTAWDAAPAGAYKDTLTFTVVYGLIP